MFGSGLLTLTLAVGLSAAASATTASRAPSPAVAARALHAASGLSAHGVTLITGDSVRVTRNARGTTIVEGLPARRTGPAAAFQQVTMHGQTYVIPADVRPYLAGILDPSLFDVTALAASRTQARIPVRLSYNSSAAPAVPGVTLTSAARGAASGYFTPASARRFGAALATRYAADAKAGFPARRTLFGATHIGALSAAPPVGPGYPQRTLIIKAVDSQGKPAPEAFVDIYNTDDLARYAGFAFVVHGVARVSVPLGTYGLDAGFDVLDSAGNDTGFAIVTKSDIAVSSQNQVVSLDARTATSKLSVRTPKPANLQGLEFDLDRTDATGNGELSSGYFVFGSGAIYVAPAASPRSGTLSTAASFTLSGAPVSGTPYGYSLNLPAVNGIPADQSHVVTSKHLATFDFNYYVDSQPRRGSTITFAVLPGAFGGGGFGVPINLPTTEDTYVYAVPGAVYLSSLFASPDPVNNPFAATLDDAPRLAAAGSVYHADWGRGPAFPNVPVDTNGTAAFFGFDCPSCRTNGRLQLAFDFATDTEPGHAWELFASTDGSPVAHLRVYRNGTLISDDTDTGFTSVQVPAKSARYRVLDGVNRVPSLALQSLQVSTDLTFVSAGGQGGRPPASWTCSLGTACTVLPLLKASVALPTDFVGSVPLGSSTIGLSVSHIQGAPTTTITSGAVQVRRPGGSWTSLPTMRLRNGRYNATLHTTAADTGNSFDLRVIGTDAAGGRIVQTASSAFAVSGS